MILFFCLHGLINNDKNFAHLFSILPDFVWLLDLHRTSIWQCNFSCIFILILKDLSQLSLDAGTKCFLK